MSLGARAIEDCLEKSGVVDFRFGQTRGVPGTAHCVSPQTSGSVRVKEFGWGSISYSNLFEKAICEIFICLWYSVSLSQSKQTRTEGAVREKRNKI